MLIVDPKDRISWEDLFKHEINFYLEEKIKKEFEETLNGEELSMNMSKFYIKNNMVIEHPTDIIKKEEINNFALNVAKTNKKE